MTPTPSTHPGALLGEAEAAATPVKGQALCFAPLDRRSTSVFGTLPTRPGWRDGNE